MWSILPLSLITMVGRWVNILAIVTTSLSLILVRRPVVNWAGWRTWWRAIVMRGAVRNVAGRMTNTVSIYRNTALHSSRSLKASVDRTSMMIAAIVEL